MIEGPRPAASRELVAMKRCAAALLLVAAATTTATAQSQADPTPASPVPPPATNAPPADPSAPPQPRPSSDPPQLLPPGAVRPLPPPADSRESTGGWFAQFIVGSVGGFGGLWGGGIIGYGLECASGCDRDLGGLLGALVGAGIGVPTGATIGVVLTDDRDHEGSGALTFIGNAPNLMVKAICDHAGVRTPSFFGYLLRYSIPVLIPVLAVVGWLFFRG